MTGFAAIDADKPLTPGLYKVVIPLYGVEKPAMQRLASANTTWTVAIRNLEFQAGFSNAVPRLPFGQSTKFSPRFPRSNYLNGTTGLEPGSVYVIPKGYDEKTGAFWCLVAVKSADAGARVNHLFSKLLIKLPGLIGPRRVASTGPLHFYKYVSAQPAASQPATTWTQTAPQQPAVQPKPAPAPAPSSGGSLGYLFGVNAGHSLFGVTYPKPKPTPAPATSGSAAPATSKPTTPAATAVKQVQRTVQQQPVPTALLVLGGLLCVAYVAQGRGQ